MAQKESNFINMVVALFAVTLISAAALGYVHDLTAADIEAAKTKAQSDAIAAVLPPFDKLGESVKLLPEGSSDSIEMFPAFSAGKMVGLAVKTSSEKGFSGHIGIMAGFDPKGNITGYEVLEHRETPGLGSKMGLWFRNPDKPGQNVIGKSPALVKFVVRKDGGEIDAITASTITSRAFLESLVKAHAAFFIYRAAEESANSVTEAAPAAPADSTQQVTQ